MEAVALLQERHVSLACPMTADLRQTDLAMIKRGRERRRLVNQPPRTLPGPRRSLIYTVELAPFDAQSQAEPKMTKRRSYLNIIPHSEADVGADSEGHK